MTITSPTVTIAIPTYNRADELRRCLASAVAQEYAAVEVVVCDNASTDHTREIVADFNRNGHRITYYRNATNLGAVANFRRALDVATGDYFMWLADDDWIDSDYVQRCIASLEADPAAVLVNGDARYYDGAGNVTAEPAMKLVSASPAWRILGYYSTVLRNGAFYGISRTADRRQAPFDGRLGSDWVNIATMAAKGRVVAAGTVIHRSDTGVSTTGSPGWGPSVLPLSSLVVSASLRGSPLASMTLPSRVAVAVGSGGTILVRFGSRAVVQAARLAAGGLLTRQRADQSREAFRRVRLGRRGRFDRRE